MLSIIVSDGDERLARSLLVLLGQIFITAYAGGEMFVCPGSPPELLLCHCSARCRVSGSRSIAVLGERCCPQITLPADSIIVAESTSLAAAELARAQGLTLFPCGLAAGDALTLSSIGERGAMLSLTRTVRALDGSSVEPFELPLELTRMPLPFTLLAAAGAVILAGRAGALPAMVL